VETEKQNTTTVMVSWSRRWWSIEGIIT